ncbi:hypothetical protein CNR22_22930 [Sphingobacteriaceae bacterium]|nr:hypothetical protein CNR22_22930 [Sphingobacteriaceae bacterium]
MFLISLISAWNAKIRRLKSSYLSLFVTTKHFYGKSDLIPTGKITEGLRFPYLTITSFLK